MVFGTATTNILGTIPVYMGIRNVATDMVEPWTETMTARERVETIATTLSKPRTANWVAEQADVKWDTAKKHLNDLVDSGIMLQTEDEQYVPDPTRAYFDHLRELILTNDQEQLRGELEAIAERIDDWRATYDVESIEDLEATLAEDRTPDEIRDRRRVLRRWENSHSSREAIKAALALYDNVRSLTETVPATSVVESTG